MLILGALVLLAQAETGSLRQGVGGGGDSPRRPCLPVQVSSPQRDGKGSSFSATEILDLKLSTQLRRRLPGPHVLQIKVFTPRGYPYQILTLPSFDPQETRGQPQELSVTLPVAGTAIVSNSLYGRWTVEPYLDGASCGVTRSFVLSQ